VNTYVPGDSGGEVIILGGESMGLCEGKTFIWTYV